MLKTYLTLAWRVFLKDRQFSLLNVVGLATGLACALLIYFWVDHQLSIDKFNNNDNRLYQVLKHTPNGDGSISTYETTQGLLAAAMRADLPEIEAATSVRKDNSMGVFTFKGKPIKAIAQFIEKNYFKVFSYQIINGNKNEPFSGLNGILLSDQLALKLFNTTTGLLGKTLKWDHGDKYNGQYIIQGIFKAAPENATNKFDALFNYKLFERKEAGGSGDISYWGSNSVQTFVLVKDGVDMPALNKKVKDYTVSKMRSLNMDRFILETEGSLFLQRYSDRYLYNRFENGVLAGGKIEYVKLFSAIAAFIIIIACINFMNLSTASASKRLKEVGVKRVAGATRLDLALQYITESFVFVFISLIVAALIIVIAFPAFQRITGENIKPVIDLKLIMIVLAIGVFTGIVSGSYPAFYLSGLKPSLVLKGHQKSTFAEMIIRKGLVVFQFSTSIILIVGVLVVYKQMALVRNKNLGYDKYNIIRFSNEGNLRGHLPAVIQKIKSIPGVVAAASMDGDMTGSYSQGGSGISWPGKTPSQSLEFKGLDMDYGMIDLLGLKIAAGRKFSSTFSDSSSIILNETAVAAMGLKYPLGKTVTVWGTQRKIIGIVKDFHFESLHNKIVPFFFRPSQNNANVFVKIKAGAEKETLAQLSAFYKRYNLRLTFQYSFLDEDYQALYVSEQRTQELSKYFAGIGIIISCLGLFGLASFTAQKRRREVGIRKIIGATARSLMFMLSANFLKLVIVSCLIAFPIAWWLMNNWLASFAYRANIGVGVFLIVGASVSIIALLTVSTQAIKTAMMSPVKSLRSH